MKRNTLSTNNTDKPLTVEELIWELTQLPGDLPVYLHFHDNGEECMGVSRGVQGSPPRPAVWI